MSLLTDYMFYRFDNLLERMRSCQNFNKKLLGQGFRGKDIYFLLVGHTLRIWDVTKLVSEHGLEVNDCTRVHLEADLLSVIDVTMG